MTTAYDQYDEAKQLAAEIESQGFGPAAEQLRNCIHQGFSGTEIFLCLQSHLQPLLNEITLSTDVRDRLRRLHANISSQLA